MELVYYFYHHGDCDFAEKVQETLNKKCYTAFMVLYNKEQAEGQYCRLPQEATLYIGNSTYIKVPIDNEDVFNAVTHSESEWG